MIKLQKFKPTIETITTTFNKFSLMTTLTTSIKALLPAVFLTAALTGVAQGYYDDDIYYNPKEEKVVKQQKKQQKPVSYYHLDSKRQDAETAVAKQLLDTVFEFRTYVPLQFFKRCEHGSKLPAKSRE